MYAMVRNILNDFCNDQEKKGNVADNATYSNFQEDLMEKVARFLKTVRYLPLLFVALLMVPSRGRCQMVYGDPSLTLYGTSVAKIEVGGGAMKTQKIRGSATTASISTPTSNYTLNLSALDQHIGTEQVFMTASGSLGRIGDVFGSVGQTRISDPYEGDFGFFAGGGVRISPPQSGAIKIGLLVEASRFSSEGPSSSVVSAYGTATDGSWVSTNIADAREEIMLTRYDVLLGFGVDALPHVRPYAGLLFSEINGSDKVSYSGPGTVYSTPPGGVPVTQTTQISYAAKRTISGASSVSGIAGVTLNASEEMGMTVEAHFGNGVAYAASAFMHF